MAKKIRISNETEVKEIIDNNKIKQKKDIIKIISLCLNILLIACILITITLFNKRINEAEKKYKKEFKVIKDECENVTESVCKVKHYSEISKAQFLDENIVFVLEGYGDVYYTYNCVTKITNGKYKYVAYNKATAISKGYKQGNC